MQRWKLRILTDEQNSKCRLTNDRRAFNAVAALTHGGWSEVGSTLTRSWTFEDFVQALKFVNQVGALAEKVNHHPDITFGYGYVRISLSTHDEKSITAKDLELAKLIDKI